MTRSRPGRASSPSSWLTPILIVGVLLLAAWSMVSQFRTTPASAPTTQEQERAAGPTAAARQGQASGLPQIVVADLPTQARATLRLIDAGGPFPYEKDGSIFQNREQLLPRQPSGYYREYTVPTPGEDDRGARRIVAGSQGELYYTDDHYASFVEVVR